MRKKNKVEKCQGLRYLRSFTIEIKLDANGDSCGDGYVDCRSTTCT